MTFRSIIGRTLGSIVDWLDGLREARLKVGLHHCGGNVKLYQPIVLHGSQYIDIGDNTQVAPFVHIWGGGRVIIGANCMIGSHVAISSLTHDYTDPAMRSSQVSKPVIVEDDVWIGSHAVVLPGIRIGRGAVIGAHALVTSDVEPFAIAFGIPARAHGRRPTEQWQPGVTAPKLSDFEIGPEFRFGHDADRDRQALLRLNANPDVTPFLFRRALARGELPRDGLFLGRGWHDFEVLAAQMFRWVGDDAEIVVTCPSRQARCLAIAVEPGPSLRCRPLVLDLLDDSGQPLGSGEAAERAVVRLPVPPAASSTSASTSASTSTRVLRLRARSGGVPTPQDPRTLNFRVFSLAWAEPVPSLESR